MIRKQFDQETTDNEKSVNLSPRSIQNSSVLNQNTTTERPSIGHTSVSVLDKNHISKNLVRKQHETSTNANFQIQGVGNIKKDMTNESEH